MSTRRAQIVVREVGYQLEKGGGGRKCINSFWLPLYDTKMGKSSIQIRRQNATTTLKSFEGERRYKR